MLRAYLKNGKQIRQRLATACFTLDKEIVSSILQGVHGSGLNEGGTETTFSEGGALLLLRQDAHPRGEVWGGDGGALVWNRHQ